MEKKCPVCQKNIKGRTDKKFCNDYCRNSYNNQLNSQSNSLIRNTNHSLSKNRRILLEQLENSERYFRIRKEDLLELGFSFKFHTHLQIMKSGTRVYYCYDVGYFKNGSDYLVVFKSENV